MTWQAQQVPADHPPVKTGKVGVLLVNLGTPTAPTPSAVRTYLAEFLSDRRVVEIPRLLWWPILHGIILNVRPRKSAHAYQQVWTPDGSPLAAITMRQAQALSDRLGADRLGDAVMVDWAMRYGQPSIPAQLERLMAAGCERIVLAPLYPQYCGATTATVFDKAAEALKAMRWQPALRVLPAYHDDPLYISALAQDLGRQLDALDFAPEVLLLSFHGMPQRTLELGDPYHCQCLKTARLLEAALDRPGLEVATTFQSRFGRAKWLSPATDAVLAAEAKAGTKRLAIAAPGFSADCLETLEELAIRGRDDFVGAGGTHFAALECLNAREEGVSLLESLVRRELSGWI